MIAAFDFDHTIVSVNSDTYINKLIPSNDEQGKVTFPSHVEEAYKQGGWTLRMQSVFDYMHSEFGINEIDFTKCLQEIKIEEPMKELFHLLKNKGYTLIIISDANTIFIDEILKQNNLLNLFESKIFTNKAYYDQIGCLKVTPFSQSYNKNGEDFDCETKICTRNICKGIVYRNLFKEIVADNQSGCNIYVGDGSNDYCPGLNLTPNDKFYVKRNFSLAKRLQNPEYFDKLKCKVVYWSSATEIISNL